MSNHINTRYTPKGDVEGHFRRDVRDALNLDIFTRDDQIIEEIRRLKASEQMLDVVKQASRMSGSKV